MRVYDVARTAHLERLGFSEPGIFVYRRQSYDFDDVLAAEVGARRYSRLRTCIAIVRFRPRRLEINEPAQLNAWPSTLLYVVLARMLRGLGISRTELVTYALDNSDVQSRIVTYVPGIMGPPARLLGKIVFRFLVRSFSLIVFGTPDARGQYLKYAKPARDRLILALPNAVHGAESLEKSSTAVFLGAFEQRKGVLQLMAAWDEVAAAKPNARLLVAGTGPYENDLIQWASTRESVSVETLPTRERQREILQHALLLVLFSQRTPRWREQVGLPIVEALSYGCEVVASDETGLARWLEGAGHVVLPASASPSALAECLIAVLARPRRPSEIVRALPSQDGRLLADSVLMGS